MTESTWNAGRLMDLATGYWKSAVLSAGVELGCFDALKDGPATMSQLIKACNGSSPHLAEVLDALVALGLLEKTSDAYRIAPGVDPFLNPDSATCMLDALRFNADLYPLWGRLPDTVRSGRPALPPGAHLGADPARTRRFVLGMHSRALALAPAFLQALHPGTARTLLDVASGPGTFSRMLAERHTNLSVTQFDLPSVLEVARELTVGHPAASRIRFCAGDYHHDDLPGDFDSALLCGAAHQEDEGDARALFSKIHDALKPDGIFHVVDMMLEPDRTGPLFSNLFSINMMLTSPKGSVFTADALKALMEETGFGSISLIQPPGSPYWILAGTRQ